MLFKNMMGNRGLERQFRFFYEIPLNDLKKYVRKVVWTDQGKEFGWIVRIRASAKKRIAKVVEIESMKGKIYSFRSDRIIEYKDKLYIIKSSVNETLKNIEKILSEKKPEIKIKLPEKIFDRKSDDSPYINERIIETALNLVNRAKDIRETILLLNKKLIRGEISLDLFYVLREEFQRQLSIVVNESKSILPSFKKYLELKEKYFARMKEQLESYKKNGGKVSNEFERYVENTEKEILLLKEALKNIEIDMNSQSIISHTMYSPES